MVIQKAAVTSIRMITLHREMARIFLITESLFTLCCIAAVSVNRNTEEEEEIESLTEKREYIPSEAELIIMDQKHAEYRLMTKPRPKSATEDISDVETVTDHVCEIKPHVALDVCDEIIYIMNWREKSFRCRLIPKQLPEDCRQYKVNIRWFRGCPNHTYVNARKCPTIPELWISQGVEKGTAYAYTRDKHVSDDLRAQHYLLFIDTLHAASYFFTTPLYSLY